MTNTAIFLNGQQGSRDTWEEVCIEGTKFLNSRAWDARAVGPANKELYVKHGNGKPCKGSMDNHIDCALLASHAGHGEIDSINAGPGGKTSILLAEIEPRCHYLFIFSCLVMTHGNNNEVWLPVYSPFYNAYIRWKHALTQPVRMICGGLDEIVISECSAVRALTDIVDLHLPVSNSFILAVSRPHHIGACLTRGDDKPEATPLYTDNRFVDQDNTFHHGKFAYLQYPVWKHGKEAKACWKFYPASSRNDRYRKEGAPREIFRSCPPTTLMLKKVTSDESDEDWIYGIADQAKQELQVDGFQISVYCSEEIGMANISIRKQDHDDASYDFAQLWQRRVASVTEVLGAHLIHLADASGNFERGTPRVEAIQMWVDRMPLENPAVPPDRFLKDEIFRLHPRLAYIGGKLGNVSIPILSPECCWSVRASMVEADGGASSTHAFEADIVVGGFNIIKAWHAGPLIAPKEAARRAKRLFNESNPADADRYELYHKGTRCGYKLVQTQEGPHYVLVYRFQLRSINGLKLAGREVDVLAFDQSRVDHQ